MDDYKIEYFLDGEKHEITGTFFEVMDAFEKIKVEHPDAEGTYFGPACY